jgi:hypothetical protein
VRHGALLCLMELGDLRWICRMFPVRCSPSRFARCRQRTNTDVSRCAPADQLCCAAQARRLRARPTRHQRRLAVLPPAEDTAPRSVGAGEPGLADVMTLQRRHDLPRVRADHLRGDRASVRIVRLVPPGQDLVVSGHPIRPARSASRRVSRATCLTGLIGGSPVAHSVGPCQRMPLTSRYRLRMRRPGRPTGTARGCGRRRNGPGPG